VTWAAGVDSSPAIGREFWLNGSFRLRRMRTHDPLQTLAFSGSGRCRGYSMIVVACTSIEFGILMPSALAVFHVDHHFEFHGLLKKQITLFRAFD
jgi:hypothetical protein